MAIAGIQQSAVNYQPEEQDREEQDREQIENRVYKYTCILYNNVCSVCALIIKQVIH